MNPLLKILLVVLFSSTIVRAQLSDELESTYASKNRDTAWVMKMIKITSDQFTTDIRGTIGYMFSVRDIARKLNHDRGYFEATIQIAEYYRLTRQLDSAAYFIKELMLLSDKSNSPMVKCRALIAKGLYLSARERNKEAIVVYNEAVALIDTSKEDKIYASILTNSANCKTNIDKREEAVEDYIKAARIFEKINDQESLAIAINNIALELGKLGRYKNAIDYYNRAISINQKIKNFHDLALCYTNASTALLEIDSVELALQYNNKAIELARERNFIYTLAQAYMNAGTIYKKRKEPAVAEMWLKKSLDLCYKEGITYGLMVNMLALGDLYDESGQTMRAIAQYDSALNYAEQMESKNDVNQLHGKLAKAFAKAGDYEKAYRYLRLYHDYIDSVKGGETAAKIIELEKMYETEKQAAEIARLEQVTSDQYFIIISLISVAGLSFSLIFFFVYKRKKAEEAREKAARHAMEIEKYSEELKELNASKDKLFSLISHDIRGPFMPILGYSEMLSTGSDNLSREEICEISDDLYAVAGSTFFLLGNLLDWARAQTGKIQFHPETVALSEIAGRVNQSLRYALKEKKVKIAVEVPEGTRILGDRMMLNSILQNLVQNAIKFSHEGSEVRISASVEGKMLRVAVSDDGVGMEDAIKDNLFGAAGVKSQPGTGNEKGTGLGMSLCAEFVERHSGKINVESTPGAGTTVSFTIPIAPEGT